MTAQRLTEVIQQYPRTLRIFRLILGYLPQELAGTTGLLAPTMGLNGVSTGKIKAMEAGGRASEAVARCCAEVIERTMSGKLFPALGGGLRRKLDKPDTALGWESVRAYANQGVPLSTFLHQRHYGGSFGQLLNATSSRRGNLLEDAVEELFRTSGVLYLRTGARNQGEIETRFGITVKPAPDFVVFSRSAILQALIECKGTNDGGTARDKSFSIQVVATGGCSLGRRAGVRRFGRTGLDPHCGRPEPGGA